MQSFFFPPANSRFSASLKSTLCCRVIEFCFYFISSHEFSERTKESFNQRSPTLAPTVPYRSRHRLTKRCYCCIPPPRLLCSTPLGLRTKCTHVHHLCCERDAHPRTLTHQLSPGVCKTVTETHPPPFNARANQSHHFDVYGLSSIQSTHNTSARITHSKHRLGDPKRFRGCTRTPCYTRTYAREHTYTRRHLHRALHFIHPSWMSATTATRGGAG